MTTLAHQIAAERRVETAERRLVEATVEVNAARQELEMIALEVATLRSDRAPDALTQP